MKIILRMLYRTKGIDLLPMLIEMIFWSDKYLSIAPQAKEFAKLLRTDKEAVIMQLTQYLKKD